MLEDVPYRYTAVHQQFTRFRTRNTTIRAVVLSWPCVHFIEKRMLHQTFPMLSSWRMLEDLYEAHGDTLSLQYGGSQLVHGWDCRIFWIQLQGYSFELSPRARSIRSSYFFFTKKSTHAREKLRCKLLEGCYAVQQRLQVATIVAKSRTGFYFVQRCAQQEQMRRKLSRYPVTPRNSSATCNATVLRRTLLEKLRGVTEP